MVEERRTRTPRGMIVAAMARITFVSVFPNTATMTSARIRSGKDIHISTKRWTMASNFPMRYPETSPRAAPRPVPTITAENPTSREILAPATIRENISLPNWSVPKKFVRFGPKSSES